MYWQTLIENFNSNFKKQQIGSIRDEEELTLLRKKIINFKEEIIKFKEYKTIVDESNVENFLPCVPISKNGMLKEITNRIDLIDKKILFLKNNKDSNSTSLEYLQNKCFNFIFNNNLNELNDFLIENPINLNDIIVEGKSIFCFIFEDYGKYQKLIKILFDFGLNYDSTIKNNTHLFFTELVNHNFDILEFLLTCNININEKGASGCTPIMATFALLSDKNNNENERTGYKKIIYLLCNYEGIEIDSPSHGCSALFYSTKMKDEKLTKFLKEKGAKIMSNNLNDRTINWKNENDINVINTFKVIVADTILCLAADIIVDKLF